MILWPNITTFVANRLGVGRGTDLVLYLGAVFGLYAFQKLYVRTRHLENMITHVVRRQAIDTAERSELVGSRVARAAAHLDPNVHKDGNRGVT